MGKQILFEDDAKNALKIGVNKIADAVGSTMGPAGRTVIIDNPPRFHQSGQVIAEPPTVTKDGVTVAASIVLDNRIENLGASMVRRASETTYYDAGDGTTQTAVLAQSIINQGLKAVAEGANPMEVKRGIEKAVDAIVAELKIMSTDIGDDNEKIRQIATTSANNDKEIGDLIGDAYKKIGKNGLLLIENSATIKTEIEVIEGYEMPRGYISPDFATNEKKRAVLNNALILVTDFTINTMEDIRGLLMQLQKANLTTTPLLVVAQDYEGEFYSSMLQNHHKGILRNCLVKSPTAYRKEHLEDIAVMTGATVIRDEAGHKLQSIELKHLGSAEKVIVSEYTTMVIGGGGSKFPEKVEEAKHTIQVQMEEHKDEEIKKIWEKRLAKINGSIGIIKVGAPTDVEQKEKLARVDDAVRAVKSSVEEGVVVGGGVALIRLASTINILATPGDEIIGTNIICVACSAPLTKMLENAGLSNKIVDDVVAEKIDSVGYNIKTRKYENLYETGILDPTKVIRCALQNAASVAGAIITSHCMIVEVQK